MNWLKKLFRRQHKMTPTESAVMALFEVHERQMENEPVYHFATGIWTVKGKVIDHQTAIMLGDAEKASVDQCVEQVKQSIT